MTEVGAFMMTRVGAFTMTAVAHSEESLGAFTMTKSDPFKKTERQAYTELETLGVRLDVKGGTPVRK